MTEATGSGAGEIPVSPHMSWSKVSTEEPGYFIDVRANKTYGVYMRATYHDYDITIPNDLIDWLIDTLVLAKEQVARPGIPDNPDEWVYAGTRKNPIKEQVGREYHDPR